MPATGFLSSHTSNGIMRLTKILASASALLISSAMVFAEPAFSLTLLHTNDIHSRVEPAIVNRKPYGGYARVATLIQRYRAADPNPIVLNAGDSFQGTLYYNVYKGLADGALMNLTGYDAMTLGNHEFDDGPEGLAPFLKAVNFPVVCANLDFRNEPLLKDWVKPWTTVRVGGQRIGVIGAMTPDIFEIANPGPNVKLKPIEESIRASIRELNQVGVNKIVLLSHVGYEGDQELAKNIPELDVIVGGHSHSFLGDLKIEGFPTPMGKYPTMVGNTVVVQAWQWGMILGRLKIDFDAKGVVTGVRENMPIPVDDSIPEHPLVAATIQAFQKPIAQLQNQVVGMTEKGLDRNSEAGIELPIGNVIADAQLAFVQKQGAQIAFMNQGGVRAPIEAGPITYGEIIGVQPFGNTLVVLDISGQGIKDFLEVGAEKKSYLQVSSGFSYGVSANAATGQKIRDMKFNGAPVDLAKTYRIVVNSFMSRGGDGFVSIANASGYRLDTGFLDVDALIEYLKAKNPIEMTREGRIVLAP